MADGTGDRAVAAALAVCGWPQRPLTDQPLPVDLLNTRWLTGVTPFDLLEHDELTAAWLNDRGLTVDGTPIPAVRQHLRDARDALAAVIADANAVEPINALLDRGRSRLMMEDDGPAEHDDVAQPEWRAPWACLRSYLRLVQTAPGRVRKCANPICLLHFYDNSHTRERRWCSMAVCGNRFKARRHRNRTQGDIQAT
jgi:predicted RNA-binding Zn ribbon-like protein